MSVSMPLIENAGLREKADSIQQFYEQVAFHESGMMYSMLKIDGDRVRPFGPADLAGKEYNEYSYLRIRPKGYWERLNNENSITASGIYLASQVYRYKATGEPEALMQAGKAFHSLEEIYKLGVRDGRPGWMGKPFGFRLSDQTSGDQYLDATWGLFVYHELAPAEHRERIESMIIHFAKYWKSIDYKIAFFNATRDYKSDRHAFNSIMMVVQLLAFHYGGGAEHLEEAEFFRDRARWHVQNNQDAWKQKVLNNEPIPNREATIASFNKLLAGQLAAGEYLCWESTIHCKFVAVAVELAERIRPGFLANRMEPALTKWWSVWHLGITDDLMPYYFFIYNAYDESWRPAPLTPRIPAEDRPFLDPFLAQCSQVRWMEPLCRFMMTSLIATVHVPAISADARELALRFMHSVDRVRLKWIHDPDGRQLSPGLSYKNEALSSEMPATYLATFWRGRAEGLW